MWKTTSTSIGKNDKEVFQNVQLYCTVPGGGTASSVRVIFLIFPLTHDTNAGVREDKSPHRRERGSILTIVV